MLLKNTPPQRQGAVQLGEDHTTPRMAEALAFYRKDMQDIVALSASPHLPWGTPWAGTAVGGILGLTYGIVKSMATLAPFGGLRNPPMKSLGKGAVLGLTYEALKGTCLAFGDSELAATGIAAGVTGAVAAFVGHPRANFHWRAVPTFGFIAAVDLVLLTYLTDPNATFRAKHHHHHHHEGGHQHAAGHH